MFSNSSFYDVLSSPNTTVFDPKNKAASSNTESEPSLNSEPLTRPLSLLVEIGEQVWEVCQDLLFGW